MGVDRHAVRRRAAALDRSSAVHKSITMARYAFPGHRRAEAPTMTVLSPGRVVALGHVSGVCGNSRRRVMPSFW